MRPMQAGSLAKRVQVQQLQTTTPAAGEFNEPTQNWCTITTRWAAVEPLQGRELWLSQQVQPDVTHRVTMRRVVGLVPKMRLVMDGRIFNVESAMNTEEVNRQTVCMCHEVVQ